MKLYNIFRAIRNKKRLFIAIRNNKRKGWLHRFFFSSSRKQAQDKYPGWKIIGI